MLDTKKPISEVWPGLLLAVLVGGIAYGIQFIINSPLADQLIIALLAGIIMRSIVGHNSRLRHGLIFAPTVFIPVGIIFYGASNLNFAKIAEVDKSIIFLLILVVLVYFAVIILLGRLLGQRKQITYLTAAGSAICGASAIVITSPAVEAQADDVSISLLSVALAAFVGYSLILPFLSAFLQISCETHCIASGSVLQFTGLVKMSHQFVPFLRGEKPLAESLNLAVSIKALRYLALLIIIPLFASLIKNRFYIPWFLWAFVGAGLIGTWLYMTRNAFFELTLSPYIKLIHNVSWSIAMAAIGINADIRELLTNNGSKAIIMSFAGFTAATLTFFAGFYLFRMT